MVKYFILQLQRGSFMKKLAVFSILLIVVLLVTGCGAKIPTVTLPHFTSTPASTTPSSTTAVPPTQTTSAVTTTPPPTKTTTVTPALPPANVTGLIYYRDAATSFTVDVAPADKALAGAVVTIGKLALTTETSGSYSFSLTPGYSTITVNADGYIPAKVSWTFLSGQSYVFNIGLYRAPASITPHAGFINGIITWDAGGWLDEVYYKPGLFQPTYSTAKANAGGSLVTVSDPVFVNEVDVNHVVMSTHSNAGSRWRMMNETEYTALVKDAHSKGLEFMLWLGVMAEDSAYNDIIYTNSPRTDSFWDTWFSEYEKYAVPYAAMAQKLGMEYVNLGHDLSYVTSKSRFSGGAPDCLARWQKLITSIRAVYHGKLTYFGGVSSVWSFYEDNDYAPGFIELFDAIGINIQDIGPAFNPSLNELKREVTTLLDRYTAWPCPVLVMVRTPSVDGGTSFDTYIEPLLAVNHEADKHAMNLFQQSDIYEAFYEVINGRPSGNGQVMGIFPWGYNYMDDYLFVPAKADGQMAMDKSGNIRGKPAEAVMKFWTFR
jgi:hypothetical protein